MAAFDDIRLPEEVERGASGGPAFLTTVIAMSSGNEQRNQDWAEARGMWNIAYGIDGRDAYEEVLEFYWARRGRARGFRFKDWSDYQLNEAIGTGDGVEQNFQLVKVYETAGPNPYVRKITRPVANTVTVYIDDVEQASGWSLQSGGVIHFTAAPAVDEIVRVACDFDVPVRFDVDHFTLSLEWSEAGSIQALQIVELRE